MRDEAASVTEAPTDRVDEPLLLVEDLHVTFATPRGPLRAVDGVSFEVRTGEMLGIVGESGSGKSVTAMTLLGLTRGPKTSFSGSVRYRGRELLTASEAELRAVRGDAISMIFQDPLTALNPLHPIGRQIVEMVRLHRDVSKQEAWETAVDLLGEVGIPRPEDRARDYPHQFSGGMRQRAMIAMALACEPEILIADEPTTALDVTIQDQVLRLLRHLQDTRDMAVVLITHDLGVVATVADRIAVMYAATIVETCGRHELFRDPMHPYTWGLLASVPRVDGRRAQRLEPIEGSPPPLTDVPGGCRFGPRCPHAFDRCTEEPRLVHRGGSETHRDACWLPLDDKRALRDPARADAR